MMLPRSFVPYLRPAGWLIISVCANQFARCSGPSTVRTKSFWALIWSSQLIGGIKSETPVLAFLNTSLMSGFSCSPACEVMKIVLLDAPVEMWMPLRGALEELGHAEQDQRQCHSFERHDVLLAPPSQQLDPVMSGNTRVG